jgi:hypothetical protein
MAEGREGDGREGDGGIRSEGKADETRQHLEGESLLSPELRSVVQGTYLHELHEEELQEVHPEVCFSTPLIPKTENFFLTFRDLHFGQVTLWLPKTSFSNSSPHLSHWYS